MINKLLYCLIKLLLRNKDKPEPPKCPDFIPDREEMTWVDPVGFDELHEITVDAFDMAMKLHPYALNNCKTVYENCYNKPPAIKKFNDWEQPEFDNPLF